MNESSKLQYRSGVPACRRKVGFGEMARGEVKAKSMMVAPQCISDRANQWIARPS